MGERTTGTLPEDNRQTGTLASDRQTGTLPIDMVLMEVQFL